MITNKVQLLENALASYQAAANELIAELKRQRNDLLEENAMLRADVAKLDNFIANQDE
jgi:regulator of replication initiation timing